MGIAASRNCNFCNEIDFPEHFFYSCLKVKSLWTEIQANIRKYLDVSLIIKEEHVLLGITSLIGVNSKTLKIINLALAIGKMVISKFKYGPKRNILEIYETDSKMRKLWDV